MPICNDKKIIFVHIPKTGGSSIEQSLGMNSENNIYSLSPMKYTNIPVDRSKFMYTKGALESMWYRTPQHLTITQLFKIIPDAFTDEYKIFCVVRNPFERLVSEWAYIQNHPVTLPKDYKKMNFEEFVYSVFKLPTFARLVLFDSHLETQKSFITNETNDIDFDINIFRFEKIDECFKWLGVEPVQTMTSHHSLYKEYYTPALEKFVAGIYKEDFDYFGYSPTIER